MVVFQQYSGMLLVNLVISGGKIAAFVFLREFVWRTDLYIVDPVTCAAHEALRLVIRDGWGSDYAAAPQRWRRQGPSDAQNLRPPVLSHGSPVRCKAYILRRAGLLCFSGDDGRALVEYSGSGLRTLHLDRKPTKTTLLASAARVILLLRRRVVSVRSANFRVCAAWCPCASAPACTSQATAQLRFTLLRPHLLEHQERMEQLGVNRKHRHSHGCASPGTVTEAREGTDPALSAEKTFSADSAGQMSRMLAKKNDKAPDTPEQLVASGRDHGLPVPYSVARKHKCSKNVRLRPPIDQTVQLAYSVDEEDCSKLLGHFPESAPPLPCSPKTAKTCHVEEHQFSRVVGPRETTAQLYGSLRLPLDSRATTFLPCLVWNQRLEQCRLCKIGSSVPRAPRASPRPLSLLPGALTSVSPAMFGMDCSSTCARQEQATSTVKVDVEAMVRRQAEEEARQKAEEQAEQQRAEEARRAAQEAAEAARQAQLEQKLREQREAEEQERLEAERRAAEEKEQARRRAQEQAEREHEERQREVASFLKQHGFSSINGVKKSFMSSTYPLHKAAELGDAHMVDQLVKAGADVAQKNSGGKTAAQVAAKKDKKGSHSATLSVLTQARVVGGA
ncbi:unnamed protein product [Symbiodinium microadriaticum]|nr:unnamed protein product [Symbiodinium microadriaticum]